MSERAQTVHDYLVGMLIVLLTVSGVFAFFPSVFTPFQDPVETENYHMADRLSDEIIDANRTAFSERTLNFTALSETLNTTDTFGHLIDRSGIPNWKQVNVTVHAPAGDVLLTGAVGSAGSRYRPGVSDPTATQIRSIQAHDSTSRCASSCRLVVRIWTEG